MTTLLEISRQLADDVDALSFGGLVHTVYNPLRYAWDAHANYLARYGELSSSRPKGRALLLGMNPGPFGMAQVGVPFGEIGLVRDWMGVRGEVTRPANEHPKRPITGFETTRSEVSGARLWGWARDRFETPEAFFERFFVHNCVPLVFMSETGANITPDKLPAAERAPLLEASDRALREVIRVLEPSFIVGVGAFAKERGLAASKGLDVPVIQILHPSPASPKANRGWAEQAEAELRAQGAGHLLGL